MVLLLSPTALAQSPAAADGKAIVYVYSYSATTTLGQIRKPVYLNGKEIADIRPEHYFIALIEPGKHTLHLKNKKFGGVERDFVAGETYYLRIDWGSNGFAIVPRGFAFVGSDNGIFDVKQLAPIDKGNIKNPEIVVLELLGVPASKE